MAQGWVIFDTPFIPLIIGLNTEADDYLDKGCEPEEILERVKELLD